MGRWVENGRWRGRPELVLAWLAVVTALCAAAATVLGVLSGQTWGVAPSVVAIVGFAVVAVVQFRRARAAQAQPVSGSRADGHDASSTG